MNHYAITYVWRASEFDRLIEAIRAAGHEAVAPSPGRWWLDTTAPPELVRALAERVSLVLRVEERPGRGKEEA